MGIHFKKTHKEKLECLSGEQDGEGNQNHSTADEEQKLGEIILTGEGRKESYPSCI
jgi:hypothetical protein